MMSNFHPPRPVRRSPRLNDGSTPTSSRSTAMLVDDFEKFCSSDSLSLEILQEWIDILPSVDLDAFTYSSFLHRACLNKGVTLEIIERLLDFYPQAVNIATNDYHQSPHRFHETYPLHLACCNENCPNSVVQLLIQKNLPALGYLCVLFESGVECFYDAGPVSGLPLHYYLSRAEGDIDLETIRLFVEKYPPALHLFDDDKAKCAPIHIILHNPNINNLHDVVQYLIEANPTTLQLTDGYDQVPLHIACTNKNITSETIQLLVDSWPQSTSQGNDFGDRPLHTLCTVTERLEGDDSLKILNILLEANPESVSQTCIDGELPIHRAVQSKRGAKFCQALIKAYPGSERIGLGDSGRLPFHSACRYGPLDTVKFFYELYPESIGIETNEGFLPIHEAASDSAFRDNNSAEILKFLLMHDPDGASRTVQGRLPLNIACSWNCNLPSIQYLFDVYPDAINIRDRDGKLPLDIARDLYENGYRFTPEHTRGKNAPTVAFLQTQMNYARQAEDSHAISTPDREGRLPLHHALYGDACLGAVKLFVRGYPESIRAADQEGWLPLHFACEYGTADVIKFLVDLDDASLTVCSAKQDSPLHHACHTGNCEVVKYLLDKQVASVSKRNVDNMLPIHILCDAANRRWGIRDTPLYLECIWRLILAHPEAVGCW